MGACPRLEAVESVSFAEATAHSCFTTLLEFVKGGAGGMDMRDMESAIFDLLLKMGHTLLRMAVDSRGDGDVGQCVETRNGTLSRHGLRTAEYLSIFGELPLTRMSYWRKGAGMVFPLDAKLNLPRLKYSYLLSELVQFEAVDKAYDKAIDSVSRIFKLPLNKLGQERNLVETASDFNAFQKEKPLYPGDSEAEVIGVAADCKGVRMIPSERSVATGDGDLRDGKRKMAVVTCDFSFTPRPRDVDEVCRSLVDGAFGTNRAPDGKSKAEGKWAVNPQSAARMDGKAAAFESLADRIIKRDQDGSRKIVVLVDGEKALHDKMMEVFGRRGLAGRVESRILDIIHVMEYLCEAGSALYGAGKEGKRREWVENMTRLVLQGKAAEAVAAMRRMKKTRWPSITARWALSKASKYFDNHLDMMRYDHYLSMGYPIATGIVEGACGSLVKDRMDDAGARWSAKGAQAVLDMRALKRNGDWDVFWKFHMANERKKLYGRLADAFN